MKERGEGNQGLVPKNQNDLKILRNLIFCEKNF